MYYLYYGGFIIACLDIASIESVVAGKFSNINSTVITFRFSEAQCNFHEHNISDTKISFAMDFIGLVFGDGNNGENHNFPNETT